MMRAKYLYIGFTALSVLITGCASHEHKLSQPNSSNMVTGKMVHGNPNSPDQLILEMAGKRFEGNLDIKKYVDWKNVRKAYGSDSDHWHRITAGLDKDHHISVGSSEIKSADGEAMLCKILWSRNYRPKGECFDQAGKPLTLHFE
jgi:hypothetical protein